MITHTPRQDWNRMWAVFLLLVGLLFSVHGEPRAACLPEQWEAVAVGDLAQKTSSAGDVDIMYLRFEQSYDYTNKMQSTRELIEVGNVTVRLTSLTDWNKMERYTIYHDKKQCKVETVSPPGMKRWCPGDPDLQLVDTFMVGGEYADIYRMRLHNTSSTVTLFSETFEMITLVTESSVMGRSQSVSMQYGNFTKGIKNKSVFDVPDYCKPKALPRCAQAEWQAVTFVKNGEGSSASSGSFRMAIDFEHQMEVYDGYYGPDEGGSKQPFKVVKFFAQNVYYAINPSLKTCTKTNITSDTAPAIPRICVGPGHAPYRSEAMNIGGRMADVYYIGKGDAKNRTMVTAYRDTLEYISLLQPHAVSGQWTVIAYQFGNYTVGIKNPEDVFALPIYCNQ